MSKIGSYFLVNPENWLYSTHGDVLAAKVRATNYLTVNGNYVGAENSIEEFVRQWALRQLIDVYGYPIEWIGERLIIEEPVKMGASEKEADISIKNINRKTFLYIETKTSSIADGDFSQAERQLETYLASTHTATIGMVTDGQRVKVLRKKIDPNEFDYIPDLPSYGVANATATKLVREVPAAHPEQKTGLTPLSTAYERLLFDCHSVIRDIDGLHADEALDELSKIIYVKVYDERTTVAKAEGTEFRFQVYGASNNSEAASNIRDLYDEARTKDVEVYAKRIPNYERSRGVFKASIKLSDAALFKITEKLQSFSFIDSKMDIKGRAFQGVMSSAIRAGMGQYFTPDPVVELAVNLIKPQITDLILDPFCGSGHFLTRCLDYVVSKQGETADPYNIHQFKFFHLHGIEKSERMVRIAMTDMLLHDDGHSNIRNLDALLSFDNYPDIIALRDDGSSDPAVFDVIVTNPPFGSIMRQEIMNMVGRFQLGHKKKSLPLEIIGVERCFQFLKPGGRMAIVLPDGLLKNKNSRFVRKWIEQIADIKAIISLPDDTFAPFGANVKTSLCVLRKLGIGESTKDDNKVFLAEIDNLGYEATGKPKSGSEIAALISAYEQFEAE